MRSKKKIQDYFKKNQYYRGWYAEKLGFTPTQFWAITNGQSPIPIKHWESILKGFEGFVTHEDLLHDYLEHEVAKTGIAKLKESKKKGEFIVALDIS